MAEKAHKRKREAGKETVFSYGDQLWDMERVENSAARVKRPRAVPEIMGMDTYTFDTWSPNKPQTLIHLPASAIRRQNP